MACCGQADAIPSEPQGPAQWKTVVQPEPFDIMANAAPPPVREVPPEPEPALSSTSSRKKA